VYNPIYEEYVDLDERGVVKNHDKINLIVQGPLEEPAPYDIGEDTASIEAHIEFLRKEMKKAPETRNEAMISDGMERTHVQRRAWIIENPRTVEEVLDLYPALEVKEERKRGGNINIWS
ncbi:hypothetical protein HPB47_018625, partial [Ixodes persulcatus]